MQRGDPDASYVDIPGIVSGTYVRCRYMPTTTAQTIAEESGQLAAQSWYNYTNTGPGAWFGDLLDKLGKVGTIAVIALGIWLIRPMFGRR